MTKLAELREKHKDDPDALALLDVAEAAVAYADAMSKHEETAEAFSTGKVGNITMNRAINDLSDADRALRAALARLGGGR